MSPKEIQKSEKKFKRKVLTINGELKLIIVTHLIKFLNDLNLFIAVKK